jgi:hypothetical protein
MTDRYLPNTEHASRTPLTAEEGHDDLITTLNTIIERYPPSQETRHAHGFYYGPGSISLLFVALSKIYPELQIRNNSFKKWALQYLGPSRAYRPGGLDTDHCGIANEYLCSLALRAAISQDEPVLSNFATVSRSLPTGGSVQDRMSGYTDSRAYFTYCAFAGRISTHLQFAFKTPSKRFRNAFSKTRISGHGMGNDITALFMAKLGLSHNLFSQTPRRT